MISIVEHNARANFAIRPPAPCVLVNRHARARPVRLGRTRVFELGNREEEDVRVLVLGASGHIGRGVVRQLRLYDAKITAPGVTPSLAQKLFPSSAEGSPVHLVDDVAIGEDTACRLLDGIDAIFTATRPGGSDDSRWTSAIVLAAAKLGTPHFVRLAALNDESPSSVLVDDNDPAADLKAAGIAHTVLRTTLLDSTLFEQAPDICDTGTLTGSAPSGRNAFVDPRDVIAASTGAVLNRRPADETLTLTGPESLTYAEVAELFSTLLERPIAYRCMTVAEHLAALQDKGLSLAQARHRVSRDAATEAAGAIAINDNILRLAGRPAGDLGSYLEDHRCAFAPGGLLE